jgi:O-acetyl-ADP-ribose deacetylase (regulator of RNase III)
MFIRYRELCKLGEFNPGDVFCWEASDHVILNLGTQHTWRTRASGDDVARALTEIVECCRQHGIHAFSMPRIASGHGGMDWEDVKGILDRVIPDDLVLTVYSLAN